MKPASLLSNHQYIYVYFTSTVSMFTYRIPASEFLTLYCDYWGLTCIMFSVLKWWLSRLFNSRNFSLQSPFRVEDWQEWKSSKANTSSQAIPSSKLNRWTQTTKQTASHKDVPVLSKYYELALLGMMNFLKNIMKIHILSPRRIAT